MLRDEAPQANPAKLEQLLSAAYALISPELQQVSLPDFPVDSLQAAALILVSLLNDVIKLEEGASAPKICMITCVCYLFFG